MDGRRQPLTRRQTQILAAIRDSVHDRGFPPTVREIGLTVGLVSSSSVVHQLEVLVARGYITRDHSSPRALTIVDDPMSPTLGDVNHPVGTRYTCPGCDEDGLETLSITQIAYTFEICTCRDVEGSFSGHFIDQLWHRRCMELVAWIERPAASDPAVKFCQNKGEDGVLCTRPHGHKGRHVAHDAVKWWNADGDQG